MCVVSCAASVTFCVMYILLRCATILTCQKCSKTPNPCFWILLQYLFLSIIFQDIWSAHRDRAVQFFVVLLRSSAIINLGSDNTYQRNSSALFINYFSFVLLQITKELQKGMQKQIKEKYGNGTAFDAAWDLLQFEVRLSSEHLYHLVSVCHSLPPTITQTLVPLYCTHLYVHRHALCLLLSSNFDRESDLLCALGLSSCLYWSLYPGQGWPLF
jgi:hypothetical protein